ncbi:MAG: hypothetical protein OQK92_06150 [Sedimenticola sp.]|uniref:Uncharacterized protein n=1 Tax=Sedimenticola thiotaurini TaxID=1543721 RepID=A0A558D1P3_9GAMM|nr:hypothetical protein [Sedimenticola sp.]MCW8946440.1 hypothetical protein [Sedimenticola sp.]MDF1527740.1 hypothetical protein [Sedimenticola sp.]TVT54937.1 MAG: hypothetical protein FHK82_09260 [Sedimenticola thiotaurini]
MFVVDDPVLALIVRFVIGSRELKVADEKFLRRQVETLKQHLARFSAEEQETKAIEWIAQHAKRYRDQWQRQVIKKRVSQVRCVDCPMNSLGMDVHCAVHSKWLELLKRYSADEITSTEYVAASLTVLQNHKAELLVRKKQEAEELQQLKAYKDSRNRQL